MSNRRSLVTGGGGFIGSHLVGQLLEQGETVRVLELPEVPVTSNVEVIRGSICDADIVRQAMHGVDRVYHLAANSNLWAQDKTEFNRVNYDGTCVVLNEASKVELDKFVYTSTESILTGNISHDDLQQSVQSRSVDDMPGPYCRAKFLAEQAAFDAAKRDLPIVIVAPTLPIGPGDHKITPPTRMILDFINVRTPAFLDCGFNLIDVRDVAKGHILAAEHGEPGERYILGNQNLTLGELLIMIEDITGLKMPKVRIPYWVALTAGVISEFVADFITHKPPRAPLTGVRLARYPLHFESDKAVSKLHLPQNSIHRALADEINWLYNKGLITKALPVQQQVRVDRYRR